jgi:thioredoxin-related protein
MNNRSDNIKEWDNEFLLLMFATQAAYCSQHKHDNWDIEELNNYRKEIYRRMEKADDLEHEMRHKGD